MRVILTNFGTSGDLDPLLGVGGVLRERGHQVMVLTVSPFERAVRAAGLEFVSLGVDDAYRRFLEHPDLWNLRRSFLALGPLMQACVEPVYRHLSELANEQTVVVSGSMALGARLAQEKLGLPVITAHMQPWAFFHAPKAVVAKIDALVLPALAPFREQLELPPLEEVFDTWFHSPQGVIGFFPDWYAPGLDLPPRTHLVGFPLYDEEDAPPIDAELESWLDAGAPPLVFTFGTGMLHCEEHYRQAAETCRLLGRRGILLARYCEQLPKELPDGVRSSAYLPFGKVLPRVEALIHHGGIGTVSQALRAGIPQLVVPFAHDQPDNAQRLSELGLARVLPPEHFQAEAAAPLIAELDSVKGKACEVAARFQGMDGLSAAADVVESALLVSHT
jgi:rhamnosyltransferase subunit B